MRNYIILNGNNSNEITGLLIQTLPPISQPAQRVNIEEIDGRDGNIITKLGYSAYNKEISIGLYGNYDVDDVIAYFTNNQSGQVTFSNEPDKYYNYEILEQIDFERLIRYRTATVTLHCQPFKYSTTEEKIQIDATEVSGSGSNITLDNTEDGALFTSLKINGDTLQNGTPTPSAPINVDVVTGDNTIKVVGKNLFDRTLCEENKALNWTTGETFTETNSLVSDYIQIVKNLQFTFNYNAQIMFYDKSNTYLGCLQNDTVSVAKATGIITNTLTVPNNDEIKYMKLGFRSSANSNTNMTTVNIQVEKGSTSTDYEPYVSQTYPVNLGVENLFDEEQLLQATNWTNTNNVYSGTIDAWYSKFRYGFTGLSFKTNTQYTISLKGYTTGGTPRIKIVYTDNSSETLNISATSMTSYTKTTNANKNVSSIQADFGAGSANTLYLTQFMIEKGNVASSFSPYGATPIELCKIGDYQDYIYKENGNWYKYNAIGKVVLDGSNYTIDNWDYNNRGYILINDMKSVAYNNNISLLTHFSFDATVYSDGQNNVGYCNRNSNQTSGIYIRFGSSSEVNTQAKANTWLSNNLPILYYQLATPTTAQITDEDLIEQLEALIEATTYLGQTNIITSGSDLNPLLEVTTFAVDDPSFVITNSGNINSKPIITIYGLGTIGLYLNGIQVLSLDMGETTSQITIDVAKMEAYNQVTGALMNRSVIGDYNNLSLNVGENTITESGTLQGLEVENYSRWL